MRYSSLCFALGTLCAASPAVIADESAAGKTWANCGKCHQPPDLTIAHDRVWLKQVSLTA